MGITKETDGSSGTSFHGGDRPTVVVELPLGDAAETFDLEKAVCSHGLFMMAPNQWDPLSKTLQRPLRLNPYEEEEEEEDDNGINPSVSSSSSSSLVVRISQSSDCLSLRVLDVDILSPRDRQSLMDQVRRMLRLSSEEDRNVREFQEICGEAKERGFGRVFRSPTLFEDMVKCILLCNCQWSRTLSMARALCELQLELQSPLSNAPVAEGGECRSPCPNTEQFAPKTPVGKESRKLTGVKENSAKLRKCSAGFKAGMKVDAAFRVNCTDVAVCLQEKQNLSLLLSNKKEKFINGRDYSDASTEIYEGDSSSLTLLQSSEKTQLDSYSNIGNFPSPRELASIDANSLAKQCNLGYRASRISSLARSVVEGRIQLRQLEEDCCNLGLTNYSKLAEQLKEIDGFGPFTCANVLMCMGFYHVIPTDSETIRHLKQIHGRTSTIQKIQQDVEVIYGKFAPFQFLAYWSEIWSFYEERFGKLSELTEGHYKLITAANMKNKKGGKKKRFKIS